MIAYIVFNWVLFNKEILQVDWSARNLIKMTFYVILNIFRKLQTRFRFSEHFLIVLIFSGFHPGIHSAIHFIQGLGISKIHENWHALIGIEWFWMNIYIKNNCIEYNLVSRCSTIKFKSNFVTISNSSMLIQYVWRIFCQNETEIWIWNKSI